MKKLIIWTFIFVCLYSTTNTYANDLSANIAKLKEYNIIYLSEDKGIYKYIGSHDGLGLSFSSTEKKVYQINCVFPQGDNQKYSTEAANIARELLPHKNINAVVLANDLLKNMNELRDNKDDEGFSYSGVRFDMILLNNMIHLTMIEKNANKLIRHTK